jgi:2-polyprenyl-6-methoxyphenol hydroxylase-like FAD-dependent oxidoreductase
MKTPHREQDRYAVVVLGGGPAGSAAAGKLLARNPGLPVLLVERSSYDRPRIGEALHPGVEAALRELGAWEAFLAEPHLPAYGTRALWGSDEPIENEFLFHRNRQGWHLDRARFDAMLARLAEERGATYPANDDLVALFVPFQDRARADSESASNLGRYGNLTLRRELGVCQCHIDRVPG